ncbi:MAG: chemotaxis protein CheD [Pseudomonadota bacterium]
MLQLTPGAASVSRRSEHISQGEVRVTGDRAQCFGTLLGSCVATVLWDDEAHIGGLNHILLPSSTAQDPSNRGHEINLMELLINGVLAQGADRKQLQAKVFGGARMIDGLGTTGAANAAFVERFLADEGIPIAAGSLGGRFARRLRVWPTEGRVQQLKVRPTDDVQVALDDESLRRRALRYSGVEIL